MIGIIGGDIVGLSFALICEKNGYDVLFTEQDENMVFNLNNKVFVTNEPKVQSMLLDSINFSATTDTMELIKKSDMIFSFVSTPISIDNNFDTSRVFDIITKFYSLSSLEIPLHNKKFIVCSTTNPGDVDQIQKRLHMFNVEVAYVPEFVSHGEIVHNFESPNVIVIGTEYQHLANDLISFYKKIQSNELNVYVMSVKAAEISKVSISGFNAIKKTYANMIGDVMVKSDVESEISMVLSAVCGDSKTDKQYLKYGFGFGGLSLPKENRVFGNYIKTLDVKSNIPSTIDDFNKEHSNFLKNYFIQKNPDKSIPFVMNHITYKKGTNIMDESQQFQLCVDLLNEGYIVNVIEIDEIAKKLNSLSESYDNRLKFYKQGTNPEGYKINL